MAWLTRLIFCAMLFLPPLTLAVETALDSSGAGAWFSAFDVLSGERLLVSLALAALTSAGSVLLAAPVFAANLRLSQRARRWLWAASLLPLSYPPFGAAAAWMTMLAQFRSNETGAILWGAQTVWESWLYSIPGAAFVLALCYWPIVFLYLVLSGEPSRPGWEAARLYLPPRRRPRWFWLPAIGRPARAAAAIVFCLTLMQFEAPMLLNVSAYPLEIYIRFSSLLQESSALGLCLPYLALAPLLAWALWSGRLLGRRGSTGDAVQIRGAIISATAVYAACVLVLAASILVPFAALWMHAGQGENAYSTWHRNGVTVIRSLAYCAITAAITLMMGLWLSRSRWKREPRAAAMCGVVLFIIPGVLLAAGWIRLRSWWPGYQPYALHLMTLLAAYAAHFFLLGLAAAWMYWNRYGRSPREAEQLIAPPWKVKVFRLHGPALAPFLPPALFLIGLFVWRDVSIITLLQPPGGESLVMEYFHLLHYGSEPRTAAVGLLLLLVPAAVLAAGLIVKEAWNGIDRIRRRTA
ncbi:MAG: hypothetical protein GC154_11565 [bacterium]|nr:hypothetical protein [bacterium]